MFVVVPHGSGFCIVNETLYVTTATPFQMKVNISSPSWTFLLGFVEKTFFLCQILYLIDCFCKAFFLFYIVHHSNDLFPDFLQSSDSYYATCQRRWRTRCVTFTKDRNELNLVKKVSECRFYPKIDLNLVFGQDFVMDYMNLT